MTLRNRLGPLRTPEPDAECPDLHTMIAIGRNGEILTRKPRLGISLEDRIKNCRRRLNIPERNKETFPLFVIKSE